MRSSELAVGFCVGGFQRIHDWNVYSFLMPPLFNVNTQVKKKTCNVLVKCFAEDSLFMVFKGINARILR